jgi:uncharacterized SAM-binding protein YcdF (DUF218 family)
MKSFFYKIIFSILFCLCVWLAGLIWFIGQIPNTTSYDETTVDAIVVLTGGSNRIGYGLELLAEGMGNQLFISGVHEKITAQELIDRNAPKEVRWKLRALRSDIIIIGHEAENTIGNAQETKTWLAKQDISSIRLVTSNYHMPRSLKEFTSILPDVAIIATPVLPDDFSMNSWWQKTESRQLLLSEYHKYLASCARHWLI